MTNPADRHAEISAEIKRYIAENFLFDIDTEKDVDENTNLFEAGVLDSYGLLELITLLEGRFDAQLDEADLISGKLISVAGIANVVQSRMKP